MNLRPLFATLIGSLILIGACSDRDGSTKTNLYAADEMWLCKPGAASNHCLEFDQTITYAYSNTRRTVVQHFAAIEPEFDCFYVYPTVDLRDEPGNTLDLSDVAPMRLSLNNQVARFTQLCDVYVPLYRQMTLGTYELGAYRSTRFYEIAFDDVSQAFDQYLSNSGNRPFVLMGHSQGSHMLLELLLQQFENNPMLRKRLISALIIGPSGRLIRPPGAIEPDSFDNIPLCTHATQTGCIITYDSIVAGGYEDRVADTRPCVNPTLLGGTPGILDYVLSGTINGLPLPDYIETPWAAQPGLHTAQCEPDGFLGVGIVSNDEREAFVPLEDIQTSLGGSVHAADFNWAMGDLIKIVATQAENMQ